MFLNSLDKKPLVKKKNGKILRDLTQSMFDFRSNDYSKLLPYRVPSEYVMRPDLISQAVYNSILHAEFILKYNGISNPFTIDVDDLILIPELDSATRSVKNVTSPADAANAIRKSYKYIDPNKFPKIDGDSATFDDRDLSSSDGTGTGTGTGEESLSDGALPPNISEEGETQIAQRNGRVYFGEGIGESACLKNGMTSSQFLTTVIKSSKV